MLYHLVEQLIGFGERQCANLHQSQQDAHSSFE